MRQQSESRNSSPTQVRIIRLLEFRVAISRVAASHLLQLALQVWWSEAKKGRKEGSKPPWAINELTSNLSSPASLPYLCLCPHLSITFTLNFLTLTVYGMVL